MSKRVKNLYAPPLGHYSCFIQRIQIMKNTTPETSGLNRTELLLLKEMASDIEIIREKKFDQFLHLKVEIDRLGGWYKWTSEEKNLVLALKLQGSLITNIEQFDIFDDWKKNAEKMMSIFKTDSKKPKAKNQLLKKIKICHFCQQPGHFIKMCKTLKKIKMKKKSLQGNVVEVNQIIGISFKNVPIQTEKKSANPD